MNYSRQRDLVLKALKENVVHPTADYLYQILRQHDPNISLATVYRNLNLLAEMGVVRRIDGIEGPARFDHNTHNHYHFICSKCNKVYDVPYDIVPDLSANLAEKTGLSAESYEITFRGVCRDCQKLN